MSNLKSLNQERASFALKKVKNIDSEEKNKYATTAKKIPAMITTNGLIPTLAFLKSKKESESVYNTINEWLNQKGYNKNSQNNDALESLLSCDFSTLRLATMEAMAFANWLKRMVEIEMKEENTDE